MHVTSGSGQSYNWAISSALSGFVTPRSSYRPTSLQVTHRSRKYHNSPMPHSIFFAGGYAIHGTYETRSLGRPASHGCIRLSPSAGATLFAMVKAEGASITIGGSPGGAHYAHANHPRVSALAYAPERHSASSVRRWQVNPAEY
jgi:lipoprotein-anchoring transpeptidase ErfK/SrfK